VQQARTVLGIADFQRMLQEQDFKLMRGRTYPMTDAGALRTQA